MLRGHTKWCALFFIALSNCLCDETTYLVRCRLLHIAGGVGVGVQGEACRIVSQDTGDCLYIYAVLDGQGGEGMPEIMKADIFSDPRFLQQGLMKTTYAVGAIQPASDRRGKHDRVVGMSFVLLEQDVNGLLWEVKGSDGIGCLGLGDADVSLEPSG